MKIEKIRLAVGLERPIRIAHLTDIHLSLADERDPHLIDHAKMRAQVFYEEAACPPKTPSEYFREAMAYAEETCDLCVITGDVIDFISRKNREEVESILRGKHYFFTAGNHEFCPQVGVPDSFARKADIFGEIQTSFAGDMFFESHVVGGVNLVTIDNCYYTYSALQIEKLEREIEKGLPIVLFSHVPLSEPILKLDHHHKDLVPDAYMMEQNRKMYALIASTDRILASFAGHWHSFAELTLPWGLREYVTPGLFKGAFTEIELI